MMRRARYTLAHARQTARRVFLLADSHTARRRRRERIGAKGKLVNTPWIARAVIVASSI